MGQGVSEDSVLIVDDASAVTRFIKRALEPAGFAVKTAGTAEEGLDELAKGPVALAICNNVLPGMTGVDFFEQSKSTHPWTYRMLITGSHAGFSLSEAINRAEVHYFLRKPFDQEELMWAVRRVMAQRREHLEYERLISGRAVTFQHHYRLVFEQSRDIVLLLRLDGSIRELNPCGRALLWISPQDDLPRSISQFLPSERVFLEINNLLEQHGQVFGVESAMCLPGGRELPVQIAVYTLNDQTDDKVILFIAKDLSEEADLHLRLIETQTRFRATLDAISDVIFNVDQRKRIVSANEALISLVGSSRSAVVGATCHDLIMANRDCFCTQEQCEAGCPLEWVLNSGESSSDLLQLALTMGKRRWWRRTLFPVFDAHGSPHLVVVVMRDVTEETEARSQIDALNNELRQAFADVHAKNQNLSHALAELKETQSYLLQSEKMASIGQLAAGVAHEINNPVAFVTSNLQSLRSYVDDLKALLALYGEAVETKAGLAANSAGFQGMQERIHQLRKEIDPDFVLEDLDQLIRQSLEGTDRVRKIVGDLKDFSHVDRSQLEYADINKGIESTLNIVWNELKYKATVQKDFGRLPPFLCYPQKLNQVFMNLLVNAGQAIDTKGEISIATRFVEVPRPGVEVEVRDTGRGIPEEISSRIFEPFFTTKPVGKGTGLGLSVSYKIVRAHRGEIRVTSEAEKGSTFVVYLPALAEEDFEGSRLDE